MKLKKKVPCLCTFGGLFDPPVEVPMMITYSRDDVQCTETMLSKLATFLASIEPKSYD